ncbi:hypothetical protein XU18_0418 [Perkinsela sp. CCAP 1560/4]|nr:hypothetical protein XU18_0418 [Perkinsela sp. CCAP 1560/4]|eukprot:KNH09733.1 hypothetical protein XU18_0418 [Perkinsela sp. CCAP 1560/4]
MEGRQFPRGITSCAGLFFGARLGIATRESNQLPSPLGEFTETIRKLHDLQLIHWVADTQMHSRCSNFGRMIKQMSPSIAMRKVIERFYGSLKCFFKLYPVYYKINMNDAVIPILREWDPLSEKRVSKILEDLLTPWGCIDLKILSFLAGNSKPAAVFSLILESDMLTSRYHISYDVNKNPYIYRIEDKAIAQGDFNCNNSRVVTSLEVVLCYVRHVPLFWIPSDLCLSCLSSANAYKLKTLGTKRTSGILKGALEFSTYHGTLFVKRDSSSAMLPSLPTCKQEYDEYKLSPMRVLKIAFCLPIVPTAMEVCAAQMFPSILVWAQSCAYTLWDIVEMFPDLMEICNDREIRSKIRGSYKDIAPTEGEENTGEEEIDFENRVRRETIAVQKLLKIAETPSSRVFQRVGGYDPARRDAPLKKANPITPFTIPEFLSYVRKNLGDHDCLPWENFKTAIMENRAIDNRDKFWRTCQVSSVNSVTFLKWINENPECGIGYREQRVQGANYFEKMFFRSDATEVKKGNEFLDISKVIEEVVFQIRYLEKEQGGQPGASVATICNALPSDARLATRHYGGFLRLLQNHSDIFDILSVEHVTLRKNVSTPSPAQCKPK